MEDILISPKQYRAILDRIEEVKNDVTVIKLKSAPETSFIDSYDLTRLLLVTNRTLQRWRNDGRLPFLRVGKKVFYNLNDILNIFKVNPNSVIKDAHITVALSVPEEPVEDMACLRCPLYLLLNA